MQIPVMDAEQIIQESLASLNRDPAEIQSGAWLIRIIPSRLEEELEHLRLEHQGKL